MFLSYDVSESVSALQVSIYPPLTHTHLGEWVRLDAYVSPEADDIEVVWTLSKKPKGSFSTILVEASDDRKAAFVPDMVGVYVVRCVASLGDLRSRPTELEIQCRQLPMPHGLDSKPNMQWLASFTRNWMRMIEDKSTAYALWSAYAQVLSRVLLRLYEVNLGKSIHTIPELTQERFAHFRLRVSVGEQALISTAPRYEGSSAIVAEDTAWVDRPTAMSVRRPTVIDGVTVYPQSSGRAKTDYDRNGNAVEGDLFSLEDSRLSPSRHLQWCIPSSYLYLLPGEVETTTLYDLGCRSGDILSFDVFYVGRKANLHTRVWGVTKEGQVSFEWTDQQVSDSFIYFDRGVLRADVESLFVRLMRELKLDAGTKSYAETAAEWVRQILRGNLQGISDQCGVTFIPTEIYRLSTYQVPYDTVSVPTLQSSVVDPVFILNENQDYLLEYQPAKNTKGSLKYLRLGDRVRFDENSLPSALWAEVMYRDNGETIESNFGLAVGAVRDRLPSKLLDPTLYRGVVGALMYAFVHGPTLRNIQLGAHAVLGLPINTQEGIIREIYPMASGETGILIEDLSLGEPTGFHRLYKAPKNATLNLNEETGQALQVGDTLPQFTPLCSGVVVTDWVKDPTWWFPLYDGKVGLPKFHEAFVDGVWYPKEGVLWPEGYLEPFEEIQKVHTFSIQLDARVYDAEDTKLVQDFIKGVYETWRRGAEKKGLRPHYTYPIILISLVFTEQLDIRDRLRGSMSAQFVADITGYEATLSEGSRNTSGEGLIYLDGALYASRLPYRKQVTFHPPSLGGTSYAGKVLLLLDIHDGSVLASETWTGATSGATGSVTAIASAHANEGPATHKAIVEYTASSAALRDDELIDFSGGGQASVLAVITAQVSRDDSVHWTLEENQPDTSYRRVRDRDVLVINEGAYTGRYRIYGVNREDTSKCWVGSLRADDITAPPPLPYGSANPYGQSSANPYTAALLTALQSIESAYAHVMRPMYNPLYSSELYHIPPSTHALSISNGAAGFHETPPYRSHARDLYRAGCMVELRKSSHANHLDLLEITRLTLGGDTDEIDPADLAGWSGSGAAYLRTHGDSLTAEAAMDHEVYDPRLPRPVFLDGATLPVQVVPDDFTVLLPSIASAIDDRYVGCVLQVLSGAGVYDGDCSKRGWRIVGYDATTKIATLNRSHRGVFDNTTVIRLVSLRRDDVALPIDELRRLFPASLFEYRLQAAVKAGDTIGGSPACSITTTASVAVVTLDNIGNIRPAGKDLTTANVLGDAPFELGVVAAGDFLVFHAQHTNDRRLASRIYEIVDVPASNQLELSPAPEDSSTSPLLFSIFRASPTVYEWDGATYVAGAPILITPASEWSIY